MKGGRFFELLTGRGARDLSQQADRLYGLSKKHKSLLSFLKGELRAASKAKKDYTDLAMQQFDKHIIAGQPFKKVYKEHERTFDALRETYLRSLKRVEKGLPRLNTLKKELGGDLSKVPDILEGLQKSIAKEKKKVRYARIGTGAGATTLLGAGGLGIFLHKTRDKPLEKTGGKNPLRFFNLPSIPTKKRVTDWAMQKLEKRLKAEIREVLKRAL